MLFVLGSPILSRGLISQGAYSLGGFCHRGLMSGGLLAGGSCPGGFCPGGFCPRPPPNIAEMANFNFQGACVGHCLLIHPLGSDCCQFSDHLAHMQNILFKSHLLDLLDQLVS